MIRVPVREDRWQPTDEVLNSVIAKCIAEAHRGAPETGGSPVLAAGGMVLGVFGVLLAAGTGSPLLAAGVVVALALAGLGYVGLQSTPVTVDRTRTLAVIGGPGNLPAGYLVHAPAWQAGLREYLTGIPAQDLHIAVRLCREYPGSIADLLRLIRRAEKHALAHAAGHEVGEIEVTKAAIRMTHEILRNAPTMVLSR